jgi:ferredoxin
MYPNEGAPVPDLTDLYLKRTLTMLAKVDRPASRELGQLFAQQLKQVAAHPDKVPILVNGERRHGRLGSTLLASVLKNRVRLMHVCGAQAVCGTCRLKVDSGAENLTPMSFKEKLSLRTHFSFSSKVRLGCQARLRGPVELQTIFPLCGNLPGE